MLRDGTVKIHTTYAVMYLVRPFYNLYKYLDSNKKQNKIKKHIAQQQEIIIDSLNNINDS